MDRTILNLLSLIIGGSGLFVVLTKFNVPELNLAFFDQNPFAVKRDAIDNVMTWLFTILALIGILLQVGGEIWSDRIPPRLHTIRFYVGFSVVSLLTLVAICFALTAIGNRIARRIWQPNVVAKLTDSYKTSRFILEHDGWREEQLNTKSGLPDPEIYRRANFDTTEQRLATMEKVLDLPSDGDLSSRLERLKPYFEKQ